MMLFWKSQTKDEGSITFYVPALSKGLTALLPMANSLVQKNDALIKTNKKSVFKQVKNQMITVSYSC